jgi:hypothetical protein
MQVLNAINANLSRVPEEIYFRLEQHYADADEFRELVQVSGFHRLFIKFAFAIWVVEAEFLHEPWMLIFCNSFILIVIGIVFGSCLSMLDF